MSIKFPLSLRTMCSIVFPLAHIVLPRTIFDIKKQELFPFLKEALLRVSGRYVNHFFSAAAASGCTLCSGTLFGIRTANALFPAFFCADYVPDCDSQHSQQRDNSNDICHSISCALITSCPSEHIR